MSDVQLSDVSSSGLLQDPGKSPPLQGTEGAAPGALGESAMKHEPHEVGLGSRGGRVSAQEAEGALQDLHRALPRNGLGGHGPKGKAGGDDPYPGMPPLPDLGRIDPMLLISQTNALVIQACSVKAHGLVAQLQRASETQSVLRGKQVKDYQEALEKEIQREDSAKKWGIFAVLVDWIVAAVEAIYGALKVVAGILSGNAMMVADGALYLLAGASGMVKALAETLSLCGVNKKVCGEIATDAGYAQMGFEGAAFAFDMMGLGNAFKAGEKLGEDIAKKVADGVKDGVKGGAGKTLEEIMEGLEKVLDEDGIKVVERKFGDQELELGDTERMGEESESRLEQAEKNMKKQFGSGNSFEKVTKAVKTGVEKALGSMFKEGGNIPEELEEGFDAQLEKCLEKELKKELGNTFLDGARKGAMGGIFKVMARGPYQVIGGIVTVQNADEQKEIDKLCADQGFINHLEEALTGIKEGQMKRIRAAYQDVTTSNKVAMKEIGLIGEAVLNVSKNFA